MGIFGGVVGFVRGKLIDRGDFSIANRADIPIYIGRICIIGNRKGLYQGVSSIYSDFCSGCCESCRTGIMMYIVVICYVFLKCQGCGFRTVAAGVIHVQYGNIRAAVVGYFVTKIHVEAAAICKSSFQMRVKVSWILAPCQDKTYLFSADYRRKSCVEVGFIFEYVNIHEAGDKTIVRNNGGVASGTHICDFIIAACICCYSNSFTVFRIVCAGFVNVENSEIHQKTV